MKEIEFYYDFGSPKSYLVYKILPVIAQKHNAKVTHKPILLGGIFKLSNNKSPAEAFAQVKGKLAYDIRETERFVARHELPYSPNPYFPVMTMGLMRAAIYAMGQDWQDEYTRVMFDAMWVDAKKMDDPNIMAEVLKENDLPVQKIMAATQMPEIKSALIDATNDAVARNVFGAPTMFFGNEMFFGKEGLADMDYYLSQS
jgi:2-hydroxychromene-2-carboxylate isomerase